MFGITKSAELGVGAVAFGVAGGLFGKGRLDGGGEVDAGLVGKADEHPKDIRHFLGKVVALAGLERLFAVFTRHDTGEFADFLHEDGGVGEFVEVADAVLLNPSVDLLLKVAEFHVRCGFWCR